MGSRSQEGKVDRWPLTRPPFPTSTFLQDKGLGRCCLLDSKSLQDKPSRLKARWRASQKQMHTSLLGILLGRRCLVGSKSLQDK